MTGSARGIVSCAAYLPHRRLNRAEIAALFGGRPGRGTRTVAGFDEDTTTMAVEAVRLVRRQQPGVSPDALWFTTAAPAYLDRTNATTVHAAVRLDADVPAFDAGGSVRSLPGLLRSALTGSGTHLIAAADQRTGRPTSDEESLAGDGAAALLVGDADSSQADLLATYLGGWSRTAEILDRWRAPGEAHSRTWEERFGETQLVPLGEEVWNEGLKALDLEAGAVDRVIVTGLHARANASLAKRLGCAPHAFVDDLSATTGNTGVAHPAVLLTHAIETAEPGQTIAVITLADGADLIVLRVTDAVSAQQPARSVADQVAGGAPIPYGKFLAWTGAAEPEPPNRPPPERPSSSVAARQRDWKYGFVGSQDRESGALHLPPQRVSMQGGAVDDMVPVPMAEATGTVVTYTVDRLVYSPSPPVVFAVIDFADGGRFACELTDVDADEVEVGMEVEMTFRRLFTSPEGIHNHFWKARPVRAAGQQGGAR